MSKNWKLKYRNSKGYWYEDENGERSQIFYCAYKYSNGLGLVQLENGKYAYRDLNGKLSEEYWFARSYSDGFGVVQLENGKSAYRDVNGNLSEEYVDAESYSDGLGLVQLENGKYAYRDVNGKLSEEYEVAYSYRKGFGNVMLESGERAYRDVDGNLFNLSERKKIERFWNGEVDVYDLEDEVFANDKLLASILKKLKRDAYRFIKLAQNKEQLETAKRYYLDAIEYVLSTAYDIRKENEKQKKLEEQERIKKQQEADKWSAIQDELLEELNLK